MYRVRPQVKRLGAYAWGSGRDGKLGTGQYTDCARPVEIERLREVEVRAVACGATHTLCAIHWPEKALQKFNRSSERPLKENRTGWAARLDAWLTRRLGMPESPSGDAAPAENTLHAFGSNFYGQCGVESATSLFGISTHADDDEVLLPAPVAVPAAVPTDNRLLAATDFGSFCFAGAAAAAWGGGPLGLGDFAFHSTPQIQPAFAKLGRAVERVAARGTMAIAVTRAVDAKPVDIPHEVYVWGELPDGRVAAEPQLVAELLGDWVSAVAVGPGGFPGEHPWFAAAVSAASSLDAANGQPRAANELVVFGKPGRWSSKVPPHPLDGSVAPAAPGDVLEDQPEQRVSLPLCNPVKRLELSLFPAAQSAGAVWVLYENGQLYGTSWANDASMGPFRLISEGVCDVAAAGNGDLSMIVSRAEKSAVAIVSARSIGGLLSGTATVDQSSEFYPDLPVAHLAAGFDHFVAH